MNTLYFVLVVLSGLFSLALALLQVPGLYGPGAEEPSTARRHRKVQFAVAAALLGLTCATPSVQLRRESQEQAVAEAKTKALLEGARVIGEKIERTEEVQARAVQQVDSLFASSRMLVEQQNAALFHLRGNLAASERIVDTLQTAEMRANLRAREILSLVTERAYPLTSLTAPIRIEFRLEDSVGGWRIATLNEENTADLSLREINPREALFIAADGEAVYPPTEVELIFYRAEDCDPPLDWERHLLVAKRSLKYADARSSIWRHPRSQLARAVLLSWDAGPFEIRTRQNVSVEDLRSACFSASLENRYVMNIGGPPQLWDSAEVSLNYILFPHGRSAPVPLRAEGITGPEAKLMWLPSSF